MAACVQVEAGGEQIELVLAEGDRRGRRAGPDQAEDEGEKASPISRGLRPTTPTPIAVIGRRSGLTAIAPTIRITFCSVTP